VSLIICGKLLSFFGGGENMLRVLSNVSAFVSRGQWSEKSNGSILQTRRNRQEPPESGPAEPVSPQPVTTTRGAHVSHFRRLPERSRPSLPGDHFKDESTTQEPMELLNLCGKVLSFSVASTTCETNSTARGRRATLSRQECVKSSLDAN
jgi:hypothetical protein